jgi:hypothetical protein
MGYDWMSDGSEEGGWQVLGMIKPLAWQFYQLIAKPLGVAPKNMSIAICILASACSFVKADCRHGDSNYSERSEIKQAYDELYMCASGKWIREKDILSVIIVEKANLWAECCGSADETADVNAACGQRPGCSILPTNTWGGTDPDPNRRKHLWVRYHCAIGSKDIPTSHYAKQAEESVPLNISCKP